MSNCRVAVTEPGIWLHEQWAVTTGPRKREGVATDLWGAAFAVKGGRGENRATPVSPVRVVKADPGAKPRIVRI